MNASAPSRPVSTPSSVYVDSPAFSGTSPAERRRARVAEAVALRVLDDRLDAVAQRTQVAANRRLVERDRLARRAPRAVFACSRWYAQVGLRPRRLGRDRRIDLRPHDRRPRARGGCSDRPPPSLHERDARATRPRARASAARVNVKSSPTAAIAASGQSSRGRTAQKQSATTSRYAVPSGREERRHRAPQQVVLVAGVEDEVLRQAARAVMVEAELLVEVGGNVGVLPTRRSAPCTSPRSRARRRPRQ